jgi:hypothetical protein
VTWGGAGVALLRSGVLFFAPTPISDGLQRSAAKNPASRRATPAPPYDLGMLLPFFPFVFAPFLFPFPFVFAHFLLPLGAQSFEFHTGDR